MYGILGMVYESAHKNLGVYISYSIRMKYYDVSENILKWYPSVNLYK